MNPAPIPTTDERVVSVAADGTTNPGVPTQVANPKRTTLRSIVQLLVAIAASLPLIIPVILGVWSEGWLVAGLGQVLAVHGVVTRIMAMPLVDRWLQTHAPWLAALSTN